MSSKNPLVPTTENMVKEGINEKRNVVEKSITNHKEKNKIDAIKKTDKPQAYQSKKKINLSEMKQTKVCYWIDKGHWIIQGLIKQMKQKTQ